MARVQKNRRGFTLIELLIVVVVGGLLSAVTIRSFSQVHGSLGSRTAQSTFLTMHAQTRALAVERGEPMILEVDRSTAMVRIEDSGGTVVRSRNFGSDYDVTIEAHSQLVRMCMTPRGVADPGCGNVSNSTEIGFVRGDRTRTVVLLPLGQAVHE